MAVSLVIGNDGRVQVLTWKNYILRRRALWTCIWEIIIPVAMTFAMVAIYNTIKPTVVTRVTPGGGSPVTFSRWADLHGTPQCTYYDSNILWRCSNNNCKDQECDRLFIAIAAEDHTNSAQEALAQSFFDSINGTHPNARFLKFTSASAIDDYVRQPGYSLKGGFTNIGAAVVFTGTSPDYTYQLRLNHTSNNGFAYNLPPTKMTVDPLLKTPYDTSQGQCKNRCWGSFGWMYTQSGALALQNAVESFLISHEAGRPVVLDNEAYDFPSPSYKKAGFWGSVSKFYGIFMIIAILYPVSNIIRSLVIEKGEACLIVIIKQ